MPSTLSEIPYEKPLISGERLVSSTFSRLNPMREEKVDCGGEAWWRRELFVDLCCLRGEERSRGCKILSSDLGRVHSEMTGSSELCGLGVARCNSPETLI